MLSSRGNSPASLVRANDEGSAFVSSMAPMFACECASHHMRLAHHRFGLLPDLARYLKRIALLILGQEELHRKRARVSLIRERAQNAHQRRDSVAGNDSRGVVQ